MTIYWGDGTSAATAPSGGPFKEYSTGTTDGVASSSSTSWADMGISTSISVASGNKVYVNAMCNVASTSTIFLRLVRNSTAIALGTYVSGKEQATWGTYSGGAGGGGGPFYYGMASVNLAWLDTPGSGTMTYKVQWMVTQGAITAYRGRGVYEDQHYKARAPQFIHVAEVT
tara:strand:+ start:492 stop:1004 length:513 start_codon:yes stop_codon:yes gene_type:complete